MIKSLSMSILYKYNTINFLNIGIKSNKNDKNKNTKLKYKSVFFYNFNYKSKVIRFFIFNEFFLYFNNFSFFSLKLKNIFRVNYFNKIFLFVNDYNNFY